MSKIRYVKQRDNFRCGPYAIVNLLKWMGVNATTKTVHLFCVLMKTNQKGTRRSDMTKALSCFKSMIKFKHKTRPTAQDLRDHVSKGGSAIVLNRWWDMKLGPVGHYFLVDRCTDKGFNCVNYATGKTERFLSYKTMDVVLAAEAGGRCSKAWMIEMR